MAARSVTPEYVKLSGHRPVLRNNTVKYNILYAPGVSSLAQDAMAAALTEWNTEVAASAIVAFNSGNAFTVSTGASGDPQVFIRVLTNFSNSPTVTMNFMFDNAPAFETLDRPVLRASIQGSIFRATRSAQLGRMKWHFMNFLGKILGLDDAGGGDNAVNDIMYPGYIGDHPTPNTEVSVANIDALTAIFDTWDGSAALPAAVAVGGASLPAVTKAIVDVDATPIVVTPTLLGQGQPTNVTVTVKDYANTGIQAATVAFMLERVGTGEVLRTITGGSTDSNGVWTGTVSLPKLTQGLYQLRTLATFNEWTVRSMIPSDPILYEPLA